LLYGAITFFFYTFVDFLTVAEVSGAEKAPPPAQPLWWARLHDCGGNKPSRLLGRPTRRP